MTTATEIYAASNGTAERIIYRYSVLTGRHLITRDSGPDSMITGHFATVEAARAEWKRLRARFAARGMQRAGK